MNNNKFSPLINSLPATYQVSRLAEVTSKTVKLDSGENLWGPPLLWDEIKINAAFYPDSNVTKLRQRLSLKVGVPKDWIAIGNGSDELIHLLCQLFLGPDRKVLDLPPSFPMYSFFSGITGATIVSVPRNKDFTLNLEMIMKKISEVNLVFIANPNNPTGTVIEPKTIEKIARKGVPLVIDEAYFEFCNISALPLLSKFDNLMILRTFSKWAGLAGLRIGYLIANPEIINKINSIRPPYNVNAVAQAAALQVLENEEHFLTSVKELIKGRELLLKTFKTSSEWRVIPSKAACVTIIPQKIPAETVNQKLMERNILVKVLATPGLKNALRISIAPPEVMKKLITALKQIETECYNQIT